MNKKKIMEDVTKMVKRFEEQLELHHLPEDIIDEVSLLELKISMMRARLKTPVLMERFYSEMDTHDAIKHIEQQLKDDGHEFVGMNK